MAELTIGVNVQQFRKETAPAAPPLGPAVLALCGFTLQGPSNDPLNSYVRSWREFESKFGGLTPKSLVPRTAYDYFNDGGSAVVVSRVTGSGAAKSTVKVTELVDDELSTLTSAPTGARGWVGASNHTAVPTRQFSVNLARDPQTTDTVIIKHWTIGARKPFEGTQTMANGAQTITYTPAAAGYNTGATASQKRLEPGSVRMQVNGTTDIDGTIYYDKGDGTFIVPGGGAIDSGTVNYDTGVIAVVFNAGTAAQTVKVSYRRIADRVERTINIDSAGTFTGDFDAAGTNTVNRTTGAIVFTTASAGVGTAQVSSGSAVVTGVGTTFGTDIKVGDRVVINGEEKTVILVGGATSMTMSSNYGANAGPGLAIKLLTYIADGTPRADYTAVSDGYNWNGASELGEAVTKARIDYTEMMWTLTAYSEGAWGNDLRAMFLGDPDFFTESTQTYSRYILRILKLDSAGVAQPAEPDFRGLVVGDASSPYFMPNIVNRSSNPVSGSLLLTVDPTGLDAPAALSGRARSETDVQGGSATVLDLAAVVATDYLPIAKGTFQIAFTDDGDRAHTIKDDGYGNLVGNNPSGATTLDSSVAAVINYTTGVVTVKTLALVKANSTMTTTYVQSPSATSVTFSFASGADGAAVARADVSAAALNVDGAEEGIYAFKKLNYNLDLALPDFAGTTDVAVDCLAFAATVFNTYVLLTTPSGYSHAAALTYRNLTLASDTSYGAIYAPWVVVADPLNPGTYKTIPPLGHVAAVMARTDKSRSVGKSPAGATDGKLGSTALALERVMTVVQATALANAGVNPLIDLPPTGRCVFGASSLVRNRASVSRYVNAQRTQNFISTVFYNAFWGKVFENNGAELWDSIQRAGDGLLDTYMKQGMFASRVKAEAYYIVCDASNNNSGTIAAGQVICEVGVATSRPAEFLIFKIGTVPAKS